MACVAVLAGDSVVPVRMFNPSVEPAHIEKFTSVTSDVESREKQTNVRCDIRAVHVGGAARPAVPSQAVPGEPPPPKPPDVASSKQPDSTVLP